MEEGGREGGREGTLMKTGVYLVISFLLHSTIPSLPPSLPPPLDLPCQAGHDPGRGRVLDSCLQGRERGRGGGVEGGRGDEDDGDLGCGLLVAECLNALDQFVVAHTVLIL